MVFHNVMVDSWICCTRLVEKFIKEIVFFISLILSCWWVIGIAGMMISTFWMHVILYLILDNLKIVCMEMEDNNFLNSAGLLPHFRPYLPCVTQDASCVSQVKYFWVDFWSETLSELAIYNTSIETSLSKCMCI